MRHAGNFPAFFWHYPAEDAAAVLVAAENRENENKIFLRWAIGYQHMSLDEFKHMLIEGRKTTEEIMEDVYKDIRIFNQSGLRREF